MSDYLTNLVIGRIKQRQNENENESVSQVNIVKIPGDRFLTEAINLIRNAPDDMTIGDIRKRLREMAAKARGG